jgi:uncharacterized membrane protein
MKSLLKSKVFWLAVVQAVAGVIVVFQSSYPEVGGLLVAKSLVDIVLRVITTVQIKM